MKRKINNILDPTISKEKYEYHRNDIKKKIPYNKWVEWIELNKSYYTWQDNTEEGIKTLASINKIPESFRDKILKTHNKMRAFAEFNSKKGYYEIYHDYIEKYGVISTTFQKPITKEHLQRLLDMANYLDAYLLNNGNKIIDEEYLKSLA